MLVEGVTFPSHFAQTFVDLIYSNSYHNANDVAQNQQFKTIFLQLIRMHFYTS